MVHFCPTCSNLLMTEHGNTTSRFFCPTCPYVFDIHKRISNKVLFERKKVDDVLGGEETWANLDQATVNCEKCGNDRAYFFQMQTRSADEPMTIFYKCTNKKCNHQWKE
eukprot:TRINITY_DN1172_c3_g2_i1.p1 TRINITY_DN1172_c3_g2~~TRINITY_DN1172_c3_g2_i1.p1  ORF type:complete len:109 (+),score=33.30 TRINITY_DN1172_c3_g2_i1:45-371(+)